MLPEIHKIEYHDLLKSIIHSQIIEFSVYLRARGHLLGRLSSWPFTNIFPCAVFLFPYPVWCMGQDIFTECVGS